VKSIVAAKDKSKPPLIITNDNPIAIIPAKTEDCRINDQLFAVKKFGKLIPTATHRKRSINKRAFDFPQSKKFILMLFVKEFI
tara:strand:- start:1562 stop:1810 length:249 start_codon:yes stop_codon:yes gene_type:complete